MNGLVSVKSFPNGISLRLDSTASFDEIILEIEKRFEETRKFFKNSKVALSIENRIVNDSEEKLIVQTIEKHSDIQIICLVGRNEDTNRKFIKALKRVEEQKEENNSRLYIGDVNEGDIIESEGNLTVIGDVKEGAACVCKNSLVVLGSIYGQIYAGTSGDKNSFIISLGIESKSVRLCNHKYNALKTKSLFSKKTKKQFSILQIGITDEIELRSIEDFNFQDYLK